MNTVSDKSALNEQTSMRHFNGFDPNNDMFVYSGKHTEKPVDFLNSIFRQAVSRGVADIHFQQADRECRVRFREGGAMVEVERFSLDWMKVLDDKLRAKSQLSSTERRAALDGRISLTIDGVNIDVRIAISPAVNDGQLIVCRLLNQSNSNKRLADINMTPAQRESFMSLIGEPNGLFLITGPTGSGKTTTLYAMLNELNDDTRNIITVENPVEYRVKDFHQIPVDGDSLTFANALRAVLRQDPDVIMVGEIRDHETASIAVQAAITGHLVLSTLHANSAASAITRMIDLGIDPMVLAAALRGVSAQRLCRRIAPNAHFHLEPPNESEKIWLNAYNIKRTNPIYPRLENEVTGYKGGGVEPIMEIIMADRRVKKVLHLGDSAIYAAASRQPQFETLGQAAERLALAGYTTLSEAARLSSIQESPEIHNKRLGQVLVELGKVDADELDELLDKQTELRRKGNHVKFGDLLRLSELCTDVEMVFAIGHTAEAVDILSKVCKTEERRQTLEMIQKKWHVGTESLFDLAIEAGLITQDGLIELVA